MAGQSVRSQSAENSPALSRARSRYALSRLIPTDAAAALTLRVLASASRKPIWRAGVQPSRRVRWSGLDESRESPMRIASMEQINSYIAMQYAA